MGINKLVQAFIDAMHIKIERRDNPKVPTWHLNQFDRDVATTENAYQRRFGNTGKIPNNTDLLR